MSDVSQKMYAYARVSALDQNASRQILAFENIGIQKQNMYIDQASGKDFHRPSYIKLLRKLRPGDLLYLKSIDRLGRNYEEIQVQWRILTREKKVDIIVLDMPLLDTTQSKDLLGTFISDLVLQLLSFVAENERTQIKQRQAEGIAAAKARGVKFGRPEKPLPNNFKHVLLDWQSQKLTTTEAARACNMPRSTFQYQAKKQLSVNPKRGCKISP